MKEAKTFARVERESTTTLRNNNQAKRLALLNISKADYKHESV